MAGRVLPSERPEHVIYESEAFHPLSVRANTNEQSQTLWAWSVS